MKIVYIAHPINGDVTGNLEKIRLIVRELNLSQPDILPFAHYFVDCYALNDDIPAERARGIENDKTFLRAGFIDELWLYGDKISSGMITEICLAVELGILVVSKSKGTSSFKYTDDKTIKQPHLSDKTL